MNMATAAVSNNPYADLGLALKGSDQKTSDSMGQDTFLKLLTTQLKNQDPLKPLDNSAFLGQLAQISTVSGIQSLQDSVDALASSMGGAQVLQASQLVGHEVLVESDKGYLADSGAMNGAAQVSSSGKLSVDIVDGSGQVVRTLDLGTQAKGLSHFSWDGNDADGTRMAAGSYTMRARLTDAEGQIALTTQAAGVVRGVTLGSGGVSLQLQGLDPVALGDVTQIM